MENKNTNDIPRWYAIHTHPKQESRAESNLKAWNVKTFLPKIKDNGFTRMRSNIIKPLFPGYIFAYFAFEDLFSKVRFTRGVHNVVSLGGIPAPVDDRVIEILTTQIDQEGFIR